MAACLGVGSQGSVTVIFVLCIPTLSPAGARRTSSLIEAAERGTFQPDIYFVVDNGGHYSRLPEFERMRARVQIMRPGSNIGVGPAWNEALRTFRDAADGIIFANDDITLASDSIERLVAGATEGATMVCTKGHAFSFFMMSPQHVRKVGYFDEGFAPAYYEDTDYLRRMQLANIQRATVDTGTGHREQSTSQDMGWDAQALIARQSFRYDAKWGGLVEREVYKHPWGIDFEVCVPSVRTDGLQRLIDSLAWQTVRPSAVTIASNADIRIDTRGLRVRQVRFSSTGYAIGEGDASLRRNVASWAAQAPYLVYSDDDQVWPQNAMEWFARRFSTGDHFVVGHHRFVDDIAVHWEQLRNAPPECGTAREKPPNARHLWQSCWGGSMAVHGMLLKYGVGGWDMGYGNGEDQQLARRILAAGNLGSMIVHEPPFAWHEHNALGTSKPVRDPNANVCEHGAHDLYETPLTKLHRCRNCPLVRRIDREDWSTIQLYDPRKVVTQDSWL